MITIKTVETSKELTQFIDFLYDLFAGNPSFVPPLFSDEYNCLNKKKNAAFEFCEAEYYLAYNDEGKIVGRVAAIINKKANKRWEQKRVRFGWFDFVDDKEVSAKLIDAVAEFGKKHGMEEMVGPLGFTDLDKEGMLTEGFDQLGTMMTSYGAPYYKEHIQAIGGFTVDARYRETKLVAPKEVPEKYLKVGEMIEKRYNLHIYKPTRWELLAKGMGKKIFELLNETYKDIYGYNDLTPKQIKQYIAQYIPFVNPEFISIIRDHNTPDKKMIGFGLSIASLSYALQKTKKGRLLPFGWWHIAKTLFISKKSPIIDLLLIGVLPEYRSKGANALLFTDLIPRYLRYGCIWAETQVQLENNENATSQWGPLNPIIHKRRECYLKKL
ncbi:MAG: N-acetyltransferase [Prevotella sp.]|nr:N-acetyltransferase [Prevotella sp.]